jgi:hypothetical protein
MNEQKQAMEQALAALESVPGPHCFIQPAEAAKVRAAIAALRAALSSLPDVQAEPSPSAQGPAELWLQLHGDCSDAELDEPVDYTSGDVTWCWHRINDSDVRYVRADVSAASAPKEPQQTAGVAFGEVPSNRKHCSTCAFMDINPHSEPCRMCCWNPVTSNGGGDRWRTAGVRASDKGVTEDSNG